MNVVECTIPADITIEQWRGLRRGGVATRGNPWLRLLAAARRVARPTFEPSGATVHPLPRRDGNTLHALDRAA